MSLAQRAYAFAAAAHAAVGQRRKYTNEPYINHPMRVALTVSLVPGATQEMIAAAYLHDVVEDTLVTIADIREHFGPGVAKLVDELTDKATAADGNRAARKAKECRRLATVSAAAQTIKLADLIDNTSDIVKFDPKFAKVYLSEKSQLLCVMHKGDFDLWSRAYKQMGAGIVRIVGRRALSPTFA